MEVLWISIGLLLLLVLFLTIMDKLNKRDSKKKPKPKSEPAPKEVPEPKTVETPKQEKNNNSVIYSSNLADDLGQLLQQQKETEIEMSSVRAGRHITQNSHIRQYIREKKYHATNSDNELENSPEIENEPQDGFTVDDYKRVIALSNIPPKK